MDSIPQSARAEGGCTLKAKDAVLTLVIVTITFYCSATLHAQQSCVKYVSCGVYSLWWADCLPPLPAGAYNCSAIGPWTEECSVNICPPPCSNCSAQAGPPKVGNPIDLSTGDTYINETDVRVPGLGGGLSLSRTWHSIAFSSRSNLGMFGPGWASSFEESVFVDTGNLVTYLRGDGGVWWFTFSSWDANGNAYFIVGAPANQTAQLTQTVLQAQPNWTLAFQNGEKRVFDYFSGKLLSITDRNGNTTTMTYDDSFRLVTVADAASRHLYFTYPSPTSYLVSAVTSDFGVGLQYAYDNLGRLAQVTEPDKTTISFQYDNLSRLTFVFDANGKVLESHTYVQCTPPSYPAPGWAGKGLTSTRANGVEAVTISYGLDPCILGMAP